jgi:hypothetical protein
MKPLADIMKVDFKSLHSVIERGKVSIRADGKALTHFDSFDALFQDALMPTMAFRAERDPCSLGKRGGRWMVVDDFGAVQRFRQLSAARRRQRAIQREGGKVYVRRWTRSRVAYYTAFCHGMF